MKVIVYLLVMWMSPTGPYTVIPTAPISTLGECQTLAQAIRITNNVKCIPYEAVIGSPLPCANSGGPICAQ